VVGFDPIVRVLLGVVERRRDELIDHRPEGPGPIGHDFGRIATRAKRRREEPSRRRDVAFCRDADVHDLAVLIDGSVHVPPPARDLHVGLIHVPTTTNGVPARPGGVNEQWREPLHPPVHGDVIDLDPPLGQELFHVAVREPEPQISTHREDDDLGRKRNPANAELGRKSEPGERGARDYTDQLDFWEDPFVCPARHRHPLDSTPRRPESASIILSYAHR
jgi:hypothetical protein